MRYLEKLRLKGKRRKVEISSAVLLEHEGDSPKLTLNKISYYQRLTSNL